MTRKNSRSKIGISHNRPSIKFILFLFCALFAPPLISNINLILFVAAYSIISILTRYKSRYRTVFKNSGLYSLSKGIVLYLTVYSFVLIFNAITGNLVNPGHYMRLLYSFFLLMPISTLISLYIILRSEELHSSPFELLRDFVFAGLIQSTIAIVALVNNQIKQMLVSLMYKNTQDPLLNTPWIVERRFYGFANSMLDLFGFGMGILAGASLYVKNKHFSKNVIIFCLLLIPAVLNARTGLLMAGLGIIFYCVYLLSSLKITKLLMLAVGGFLCLVALTFSLNKYAPSTLSWVLNDVGSFTATSSLDRSTQGTANTLFSANFWAMPDTIGLMMGTGHTLYQADGFRQSDVGFVNDIWRTGVVGTLLLYILFVIFIRNGSRSSSSKELRYIQIYFGICMLLFLIKGNIWVYSPGMIIIMSLAGSISNSSKVKPKND